MAMTKEEKFYLTFDENKKPVCNFPARFINNFLTEIGDNKYLAIIVNKYDVMDYDDDDVRSLRKKIGFILGGYRVLIGTADKLEDVKIVSSAIIHGHWFIEAEGIFISYFLKTNGIPDKPYDEYSFAEKDGIFHVIPPENIFQGLPIP
jgi:hypothetical protein